MSKYDFLREYVGHNTFNGYYFMTVKPEETADAEKKIGTALPSQLREFYEKIGHGILSGPDYDGNVILPPYAAAEFFKPLKNDSRAPDEPLSTTDEEYWMSDSAYEDIQPGDLPFFEISDGSKYLVMRPHSKNPNAVWFVGDIKIEDSFEKFIWRLYYEDPAFYDNVIEEYFIKLDEESEQ